MSTPPSAHGSQQGSFGPRLLAALVLLFLFLLGVKGLGDGFKLLGQDLLQSFFAATENPFIGLTVGLLATTIVQSSSVTTSMLRKLLSIFRASDPLAEMGENFRQMLQLTYDMSVAAGQIFFSEGSRAPERERIYEWDGQVNELERLIRRQVVTHLAVKGNEADLPCSLLLISLVKDVERLGDYAKNLSEIVDIRPDPLPAGHALTELGAIRARVEHAFRSCADVFVASHRDRAFELIREGRETARRCDRLVADIGHGDYDAATTTALILGTRYYKRIGGHVLNVLSSVVMPLDSIDYFDASGGLPGDEVPGG